MGLPPGVLPIPIETHLGAFIEQIVFFLPLVLRVLRPISGGNELFVLRVGVQGFCEKPN